LLLNAAEGLVTATELLRIGERESLLTLVQVYEVDAAGKCADLVHYEPSVILGHGNLIKVYIL
jgi:hypothetical protein